LLRPQYYQQKESWFQGLVPSLEALEKSVQVMEGLLGRATEGRQDNLGAIY
jgi:hypothetical protein